MNVRRASRFRFLTPLGGAPLIARSAAIGALFAAVCLLGEPASAQQALRDSAPPAQAAPDIAASLAAGGGIPELPPPEARVVRAAAVWPGYAVMFVLAVVVIGISMMPSKRAHTD